MRRLTKITEFIDQALIEIEVVGKHVHKGRSLMEFEKESWRIYKGCESAIFLLKLEMASIEAPDDTKINIDKDHLEHSLPKADKYIRDSRNCIDNVRLDEALLNLRLARNIMADICTQIKKRNLSEKRRKAKESTVQNFSSQIEP